MKEKLVSVLSPPQSPPPGWNNAKITLEAPPPSQAIALKMVLKNLPRKTITMTTDSRQGSEAAILGSKKVKKGVSQGIPIGQKIPKTLGPF